MYRNNELVKLAAAAVLIKTAKKPRPSSPPSRMSPDVLSNAIYGRPVEYNNPLLQFERTIDPLKEYLSTYGNQENLQRAIAHASSVYPDSAGAHNLFYTHLDPYLSPPRVPVFSGHSVVPPGAGGAYYTNMGRALRNRTIRNVDTNQPLSSVFDIITNRGNIMRNLNNPNVPMGIGTSTPQHASGTARTFRHELGHHLDYGFNYNNLSRAIRPLKQQDLDRLLTIVNNRREKDKSRIDPEYLSYVLDPVELFAEGSYINRDLAESISSLPTNMLLRRFFGRNRDSSRRYNILADLMSRDKPASDYITNAIRHSI